MELGSESGIWSIKQDSESLKIRLLQYGKEVESWAGERIYTFEELHDLLVRKSYAMRGEKNNGNIPE